MAGPSRRSEHPVDPAAAWSACGASALSGPPPGGGLGPPARLVPTVLDHGRRLTRAASAWGGELDLDWLGLLAARAEVEGLSARGRTSCGGATRLLRGADSWVAVSLARPTDADLLPAWAVAAGGTWTAPTPAVAAPGPRWTAPDSVWGAVADTVASRPAADLVAAADLLGLPVGAVGERVPTVDGGVTVEDAPGPAASSGPPVRIVDLSTLWAGPLCARLLGQCGAEVVKVSSVHRPDGAATGNPVWYRELNGHKHHVELDLSNQSGRAQLADLLASADVVVESARPRGLAQMGIVADDVLAASGGPRVWVSITGHGRGSARVAFGDDAAVAGGLVVEDRDGPWFCGDAVADPLSGIAAAAVTAELLASGRRGLVDVAMAGVAAAHAGPTLPAADGPDRGHAAAGDERAR